MVPTKVISNFKEALFFYILPTEAAVADELARRFQQNCPEAIAKFGVAPLVARNPVVSFGAGEWAEVEEHGIGVANHAKERAGVFGDEFAQDEARGFDLERLVHSG